MRQIGNFVLDVIEGDITQYGGDAIVNAANSSLLGGGGVDGAIHRAAGPDLVHECRLLGGCKTGQAKITGGYRLAARHIIHTVGPVWCGGQHNERELLASCYRSSLELAAKHQIRSIAFPAISTGIYRFPIEDAAVIATDTAASFVANEPHELEEVIFVCFSCSHASAFRDALAHWSMPG